MIYLNQSHLAVTKQKQKNFLLRLFYTQVDCRSVEPPQEVASYTLKKGELKMVRPKYNTETGEFLGLCKTFSYMLVRGSPEEVIFNYGFDKENSKVLYSHYRRRITNAFCGTMFNRHKLLVESVEV